MALWKPTRRTILRAGGLIAAPAIIGRALAPAQACMTLTGAGGACGGGAAPSTATWDPASNFQLTLTNTNTNPLTATNSVGAGNFGNARSTTSHSTGKFYVKWTITFSVAGQCGIGLVDTTQASPSGFFLGGGPHVMGINSLNGQVLFNGPSLGQYTPSAVSSGDVVGMAVDIGAGLGWWQLNGVNWNNDIIANQNPATGAGGYAIGLTGSLFLACDVEAATISGTLNAGAAGGPAGFGNWT